MSGNMPIYMQITVEGEVKEMDTSRKFDLNNWVKLKRLYPSIHD